jgi:hypothetical protein
MHENTAGVNPARRGRLLPGLGGSRKEKDDSGTKRAQHRLSIVASFLTVDAL